VHSNRCTKKNVDHIKLINKKFLFEDIKASFFALALADSSRAFRAIQALDWGLGLENTGLGLGNADIEQSFPTNHEIDVCMKFIASGPIGRLLLCH